MLFLYIAQPVCDECKSSLTVKHVLLERYNLKNVSDKYFTCSSGQGYQDHKLPCTQ